MTKSIPQIIDCPKDAVLQDGIFKNFTDSPLTKDPKVKDVCIYVPDLNKIGKEGKTRWDSFPCYTNGSNVWSLQMRYKKQTENTTMASFQRCLLMNHLTGFI